MVNCCVISRFVYESVYLDSFIEHYIELGFDKIIILYHDIEEYNVLDQWKSYVMIVHVQNWGNKLPHKYKQVIPSTMDWVLHVDSDEFLLLHRKYRNIKEYIEDKLSIDENINVFTFMWSWVHKFESNYQETLNDIFIKYKKFVGNRLSHKDDTRKNKQEVWIKSMFKLSVLKYFHIHCPSLTEMYVLYNNEVIYYDNNGEGEGNKIKSFLYKNGEKDEEKFYKDVVLMHLSTRDLKNTIFKSLNMHSTQQSYKKIEDKDQLLEEIKYTKDPYDILEIFRENIGYKIEWPLTCLNRMNEININISDYLRNSKTPFTSRENTIYENINNSIINNKYLINSINKVSKQFNVIFIEDNKNNSR